MQQFVHQSDNLGLQSLFWTLYTFEKLSQKQAHRLLYLLPLETLSIKANVSSSGSIDQMVQLMQRIGCSREQMTEFVEMLDIDQIGLRAKQGNLRRFTSLLRTLRAISISSGCKVIRGSYASRNGKALSC